MNVAIVHDHLLYLGGAERVALALLRLYPNADVFTAFVDKSMLSVAQRATTGSITVSPYNQVIKEGIQPDWLKPFVSLWWGRLDLRDYDLVISSSHSYSSKSACVPTGILHISYIHTSPRFLYEEFSEAQWLKRLPWRLLLYPVLSWMRRRDFQAAQRPDVLIANSKTVQARIKRYYKRDSIVLYPPVSIPKRMPRRDPQYYLCVSRLVKQKGIDLAIRACNQLRAPLVVVGEGAQEARLRALAGPTVSFRGWVADEEMTDVYAGAKALIFSAIEEDFGMAPVEAMGHGVPVIAYNSGGVRETVVDGKTGALFNHYTTKSLISAVNRAEGARFPVERLRRHAQQFSEERFIHEFTNIVDKLFKNRQKQ